MHSNVICFQWQTAPPDSWPALGKEKEWGSMIREERSLWLNFCSLSWHMPILKPGDTSLTCAGCTMGKRREAGKERYTTSNDQGWALFKLFFNGVWVRRFIQFPNHESRTSHPKRYSAVSSIGAAICQIEVFKDVKNGFSVKQLRALPTCHHWQQQKKELSVPRIHRDQCLGS